LEALITEGLLPLGMFALMTGMGLTLSVDDFRRTAEAPRAVILGTLLQLLVMPLAGIGIARFFELPPLLAAGLVIIAACPGGMFSNVFVYMARANTVLSVTLTATATMVTLFTLPLWVRATLALNGAGGDAIEMPILGTAMNLAGLTVLPVLFGMWLRARQTTAVGFEQRLTRFGFIAIVIGATVDGISRPEMPVDEFRASLVPALAVASTAVALGLGAAGLFRLPVRDVVTIAVEMIVKNSLLGLVVARTALDFEATLPILAFATVQTPVGLLLLGVWWVLGGRHQPPHAASTSEAPS
jgi:BASS family bile acid:Na+ symporter